MLRGLNEIHPVKNNNVLGAIFRGRLLISSNGSTNASSFSLNDSLWKSTALSYNTDLSIWDLTREHKGHLLRLWDQIPSLKLQVILQRGEGGWGAHKSWMERNSDFSPRFRTAYPPLCSPKTCLCNEWRRQFVFSKKFSDHCLFKAIICMVMNK